MAAGEERQPLVDVEQGVAAPSESEEAGLYTLTRFTVREGIPLPESGKTVSLGDSLSLWFSWFLGLGLIAGVFFYLHSAYVSEIVFAIKDGAALDLNSQNCDVEFRSSDSSMHHLARTHWYKIPPESSYMHVRLWKLSSADEGKVEYNASSNVIKLGLSVAKRQPFFACRAAFYLAASSRNHFRRLKATTDATDHAHDIYSNTPVYLSGESEFQVTFGQMRLERMFHGTDASSLFVNLTGSYLNMRYLSPADPVQRVKVIVKNSPVAMKSYGLDLALKLNDHAAAHALVAGKSVSGDLDGAGKVTAGAEASRGSVALEIESGKNDGVYVLAAPPLEKENEKDDADADDAGHEDEEKKKKESDGPKYVTKMGKAQKSPALHPDSILDLQNIEHWVKQMPQAPYIVYIHMHGAHMPVGTWRFMSTKVYLAFSTELFVMFSGGMLQPRMLKLTVPVLGFDSWTPGDKLSDSKINKIAFSLFAPYLNITENAAVVYTPSTTGEKSLIYEFDKKGRVQAIPVDLADQAQFILAAGLNLMGGFLLAAILVGIAYKIIAPQVLREMRDKQFDITASHRLTWALGSRSASWRLLSMQADCDLDGEPSHGILLRWARRPKANLFVRYQILCEASKPRPHKFTMRVKKEQVKARKNVPDQQEFFISTRHPNSQQSLVAEPFHDDLRYGFRYRFMIRAWSAAGRIVEQSTQSNVIQVAAPTAITEMPFLLLQTVCPAPVDSLREFIDKYTVLQPETALVFEFHDMTVAYNASRPPNDPALDEGWKIFFFFGDSADRAQELTEVGEQMSYAVSDALPRLEGIPEKPPPNEEFIPVGVTGSSTFLQRVASCIGVGSNFQISRGDDQQTKMNVAVCSSTDERIGETEIYYRTLIRTWDSSDALLEVFVPLSEDAGYSADAKIIVRCKVRFRYRQTVTSEVRTALSNRGVHLLLNLDIAGMTYDMGLERRLQWNPMRVGRGIRSMSIQVVFLSIPWKKKHASREMKENGYRQSKLYPYYLCKRITPAAGIDPGQGSFSWTIFLDEELFGGSNTLRCTLEMTSGNQLVDDTAEGSPARSSIFFVRKTLLLADFELAYASFCRMNACEMQPLEESQLSSARVSLARTQVRIAEGVRDLMPFERAGDGGEYHVVEMSEGAKIAGDDVDGLQCTRTALDELLLERQQVEDCEERDLEREVMQKFNFKTFVTKVQKVDLVDNSALNEARNWTPTFLLPRGVHWVPYLMGHLETVMTLTMVNTIFQSIENNSPRFLQPVIQSAGLQSRTLARSFLLLLNQAVAFAAQLLFFLAFPLTCIIFVMLFQFVQQKVHPGYWTHDATREVYVSDMAFTHDIYFLSRTPPAASYTVLFAVLLSVLIAVLVFWTNFLGTTVSPGTYTGIQRVNRYLNVGSMGVFLVFVGVTCLWFVLGALIDPDALMPYAVMVGSVCAVVKGLWQQLNDLKEKVLDVVNDQIDLILEVVLDTFFEITGIDPEKIEETTVEERKKTDKMKAAAKERQKGVITKFCVADASGSTGGGTSQGGQGGGANGMDVASVSENLVKLQKVYKYLLNQMAIEDLLELLGLSTVVTYLKSIELMEAQFLQTWAAQMVPLFGMGAMQFVPTAVRPLVEDLVDEATSSKKNKIDAILWKFMLTKRASVNRLYTSMMDNLYDPDVINDGIGSFYDTEIDKLLRSDLNYFLSPSALGSPLAKKLRGIFLDLEARVLAKENSSVSYFVGKKPASAKLTDTDIFSLMMSLGLLPDKTDFKKRFPREKGVFQEKALLDLITAKAATVSTDEFLDGTVVVNVIKKILDGRITWNMFNFLLLVVAVVDVELATVKMVANTVSVYHFGPQDSEVRALVNGYYYRKGEKNGKPRYVMTRGTGASGAEIAEIFYEPPQQKSDPAKTGKPAGKPPSGMWLLYDIEGKKALYRCKKAARDIPGEAWEAVRAQDKPVGIIKHDFDQAKAFQDCAELQIGYKGDTYWDNLTKRAVKVFGDLSDMTGLLPQSKCVEAILDLTASNGMGGLWKEAAVRLLQKLKLGGEYGREDIHDRDRARENGFEDRLDAPRGSIFPSDWWINKYPAWDWSFKETDDELSLDECWAEITTKTDGFMTKTGFFVFLDCIRYRAKPAPNMPVPIQFMSIRFKNEADEIGTGDKPYRFVGGKMDVIEERATGVIYKKQLGAWNLIRGITLEQLEELLNKWMNYNMDAKSLRNLWRSFFSTPYVRFDELYNGVYGDTTNSQKQILVDDGDPAAGVPPTYKTFMQFVGTEIITLESLETLLQEVHITLPPAVIESIYKSCDEPEPATKFGVIKRLRQNLTVTAYCTYERFKTLLDSDEKFTPDAWDAEFSEPLACNAPRINLSADAAFPITMPDGQPSITLPANEEDNPYLVERMVLMKGKMGVGNVFTAEEDPTLAANEYSSGPPRKWLEETYQHWLADNPDEQDRDIIVEVSVRSLDGCLGDWRGDAVSVADIKEAIPEYLKQGLWFEALHQICTDVLGLPYPEDMLREVFEAVDVNNNGFLDPSEFYHMVNKIFKMGMRYPTFKALVSKLGLKIDDKWLQKTFQSMDLDQNQTLSVSEFLGGMDILISEMIPALVLDKTGLTAQQIMPRIAGAVSILLVIFAFIILAMQAFTGLGGSSSVIQSVLAGGSALGVKSESAPDDIEKLRRKITELVYSVMQIDKKKVKESEKKKGRGEKGKAKTE